MEPRLVRDFLETHFAGMEADLETEPDGRVSGEVTWANFAGQEQLERQRTIRNALRDRFGANVQEVGVLLTYTPAEVERMVAA